MNENMLLIIKNKNIYNKILIHHNYNNTFSFITIFHHYHYYYLFHLTNNARDTSTFIII